MRIITTLSIFLFVIGCTAPNYKQPIDLNNTYSKVRFMTIGTKGKNVLVYKYKTKSCTNDVWQIAALGGMAIKHNRQRIGIPLGNNINDKMLTEVLLKPSQPYIFSMAYWGFFKTCNINFNFIPEESKMYEIKFEIKNKKTCEVEFFEITETSENQYKKSTLSNNIASISKNSCKPGVLK